MERIPYIPGILGHVSTPQIGRDALRVLKAVYLGAVDSFQVAEATGLARVEVLRLAAVLRRSALLCCDLPQDVPQLDRDGQRIPGEDWCVRDESRRIPEMARLRGLRVDPGGIKHSARPTARAGRGGTRQARGA